MISVMREALGRSREQNLLGGNRHLDAENVLFDQMSHDYDHMRGGWRGV